MEKTNDINEIREAFKIMDTKQKADDNDPIFSGMIRYEDVKKALADGKEK